MSRGRKLLSRAMGEGWRDGSVVKIASQQATVGSSQSPVTPALNDSDAVFCSLQKLQTQYKSTQTHIIKNK